MTTVVKRAKEVRKRQKCWRGKRR